MKCFPMTVVICLLIANFRLFGNAEKEMQIASITGAILRQLPDAGSKRVTQLPFLETVKIIEEDAKANIVLGVSGNWKPPVSAEVVASDLLIIPIFSIMLPPFAYHLFSHAS
jgi:hypothetical protein